MFQGIFVTHRRRKDGSKAHVQYPEKAETQRSKIMRNNDEGIAYGYFMLLLYLFSGIFIWMCWSYVFNSVLGSVINPDIAAGGISLQTRNAVNWSVDFFRYAPPVMLLAGFVWATNRAIFKRNTGG